MNPSRFHPPDTHTTVQYCFLLTPSHALLGLVAPAFSQAEMAAPCALDPAVPRSLRSSAKWRGWGLCQ